MALKALIPKNSIKVETK